MEIYQIPDNDNIEMSPLKNIKGKLISDSKERAEILIKQFKSVFIMDKSTTIPEITIILRTTYLTSL